MSDDALEMEYNYKPRSVDNLFSNSFFDVPRYQRGYAWQADEQVNDLLIDLSEALKFYPDDYYLLGQIIVTSKESSRKANAAETFEVVDGQQRLTTLFLIILALKNQIPQEELVQHKDVYKLEGISARLLDADDSGNPRTRIKLASDVQETLEALVFQVPSELSKKFLENILKSVETSSQENLIRAWQHINDFFKLEAKTTSEKFRFLEFVMGQVVLVRLKVRDSSQALNIFWKTNDRGLDLDDADLLKNLLFISVKDEIDYANVSDNWAIASKSLHSSKLKRVKGMIFLMKAMIGILEGRSIPQNSVYEHWQKIMNPKPLDSSLSPTDANGPSDDQVIDPEITSNELTPRERALNLASSLPHRANSIRRISHGRSPMTDESRLEICHGSYTFKAVQHFQVLLAGDHLQEESYLELLRIVEDRVIVSLLAGESTQDFERLIHPWSQRVRGLNAGASRSEILIASQAATKNVEQLFEQMKVSISQLNYLRSSHYWKIRYILARVTRYCEVQLAGDIDASGKILEALMSTQKDENGFYYQVDHIFPKAKKREPIWNERLQSWLLENDDSDEGKNFDFIHSIGNLTLLHSKDNLDQLDYLPDDAKKIASYAGKQQKWIVNHSLQEIFESDGQMSDRYRTAFEDIRKIAPVSLSRWNPGDIKSRELLYWTLLRDDLRCTFRQDLAQK